MLIKLLMPSQLWSLINNQKKYTWSMENRAAINYSWSKSLMFKLSTIIIGLRLQQKEMLH